MVPATIPYASDGTSVSTSISGMRPCMTGEPGPVSDPSGARIGESGGATIDAKPQASASADAAAIQSPRRSRDVNGGAVGMSAGSPSTATPLRRGSTTPSTSHHVAGTTTTAVAIASQ